MIQVRCTACGSDGLHWETMRADVPFDALRCRRCGTLVAREEWLPPLDPLLPGRCLNCGHTRDATQCERCGLTRDEDLQVHDELRFMVAPELDHLDAARKAARLGRNLMALELATAAAALDEDGCGDEARALRIWLLSAIGEPQRAREDAKAWVEDRQE